MISKDKLSDSLKEREKYFNSLSLNMGNNNIQINDKDRKAVIELLSASEVTIDAIAQQSQLELPILYTIFLELELAGKIIRSAGNKISLIY